MKSIFISLLAIVFSLTAYAGNATFAEQVAMGAQGEHRSEPNKARDQYRHPAETLAFFGRSNLRVVAETSLALI